ncbi:GGDEF domain-containing protein [Thalassoglobus polymorphus]|uniref:GGDEF domain-containing protein n=1 Tax=Thalassoglobus polymorphus TaxID=2527994 RepID=UPI0018D1FBAC|nr:GGDEF domain-containing protein [Thalassoglobus polymorphus]
MSFLLIVGCLLILQWSNLGWSTGKLGPSILLIFSALAGWTFKQPGVTYTMGMTCMGMLILHAVQGELHQQAIVETARATFSVGAVAQLMTVVRSIIDDRESISGSDPLTNLLNLKRFKAYVDSRSASDHPDSSPFAIALLDCDQFKSYNDTHGHLSGDQYLIDMANRIDSSLVEGEFAARWGGDEFAILYLSTNEEFLVDRLRALQQSLASTSEQIENSMTWSVGIAIFSSPENFSADEMINRADQAMYAAKRTGRGQIHVVSDSSGDGL